MKCSKQRHAETNGTMFNKVAVSSDESDGDDRVQETYSQTSTGTKHKWLCFRPIIFLLSGILLFSIVVWMVHTTIKTLPEDLAANIEEHAEREHPESAAIRVALTGSPPPDAHQPASKHIPHHNAADPAYSSSSPSPPAPPQAGDVDGTQHNATVARHGNTRDPGSNSSSPTSTPPQSPTGPKAMEVDFGDVRQRNDSLEDDLEEYFTYTLHNGANASVDSSETAFDKDSSDTYSDQYRSATTSDQDSNKAHWDKEALDEASGQMTNGMRGHHPRRVKRVKRTASLKTKSPVELYLPNPYLDSMIGDKKTTAKDSGKRGSKSETKVKHHVVQPAERAPFSRFIRSDDAAEKELQSFLARLSSLSLPVQHTQDIDQFEPRTKRNGNLVKRNTKKQKHNKKNLKELKSKAKHLRNRIKVLKKDLKKDKAKKSGSKSHPRINSVKEKVYKKALHNLVRQDAKQERIQRYRIATLKVQLEIQKRKLMKQMELKGGHGKITPKTQQASARKFPPPAKPALLLSLNVSSSANVKPSPNGPPPANVKSSPNGPPPANVKSSPNGPPPANVKSSPNGPPPANVNSSPNGPPPANVQTQWDKTKNSIHNWFKKSADRKSNSQESAKSPTREKPMITVQRDPKRKHELTIHIKGMDEDERNIQAILMNVSANNNQGDAVTVDNTNKEVCGIKTAVILLVVVIIIIVLVVNFMVFHSRSNCFSRLSNRKRVKLPSTFDKYDSMKSPSNTTTRRSQTHLTKLLPDMNPLRGPSSQHYHSPDPSRSRSHGSSRHTMSEMEGEYSKYPHMEMDKDHSNFTEETEYDW